MKFKNLYAHNSVAMLILPVLMFPPAWIANKWLVGILNFIKDLLIEELHLQDLISLV